MPQNRFGLCPLYTDSFSNAVNDEMLIDSRTGDTALKRSDGKIIQGNNISRLYTHKTSFINRIMCNGLVDSDIYLLDFNDPTTSKRIIPSTNILDAEIELNNGQNTIIPKFSISLDVDILQSNDKNILMSSDIIPDVEISYTIDGNSTTDKCSIYQLPTKTFSVNSTSFIISGVKLLVDSSIDLSKLDIILHSILIAYR